MKVGLYFGTFNPIHIGHLVIANHMVQYTDLDEVWMVVTPHSPLKKKKGLLEDFHRIHMVNLATADYDYIKPSDVEFNLPQPNYTVNTMAHLHERYPKHEFSLLMGQDNLDSLPKWKNYEVLLERYPIYVYPRIFSGKEEANPLLDHPNIHLVENAPIMEISATFIRDSIKEGKNIMPLLDKEVWKYIDHNLFYKK
ncbi:nicotinate (nicotinamide) nucleotide adenylyltransferase [Myroides odoratimimus]|uniref:nicotinate (nicotinamide) nucleotide adenylyltransferase n=1 Tax=Myroides odoratimimus TaxID=76832 RepID=UPI00046A4A67|nr:nicotinate (nicotinamide) nucleotide adenylyltransferase [Myroides odoratimimus]MDM1517023.1 nicotinate-nucleotide adenylyltransferase [Myroides odoratimimus]MDM1536770.1 nicotinate-nucleotide adenylyltransferase [Myroides odoratimimus]MDM1676251.1 nicotinate-nucleotide adenylyltransferase [Myroides odoratimimus]